MFIFCFYLIKCKLNCYRYQWRLSLKISLPLTIVFITLLVCVAGVVRYKRWLSLTSGSSIKHRTLQILKLQVLSCSILWNILYCQLKRYIVHMYVSYNFVRNMTIWWNSYKTCCSERFCWKIRYCRKSFSIWDRDKFLILVFKN